MSGVGAKYSCCSVERSSTAIQVRTGTAGYVAPVPFGLCISAMKIHRFPSAPISPSIGQNQVVLSIVCASPTTSRPRPPTIVKHSPCWTSPALCAAFVGLPPGTSLVRSSSLLKCRSWNIQKIRPSGSG